MGSLESFKQPWAFTGESWGFVWGFQDLRPLVGLVVLFLGFLVWIPSRTSLNRNRRVVSTALRLLVVFCLGAALSGPTCAVRSSRAHIAVALDVSDSMDVASIERGLRLFRELSQKRPTEDQVRLIAMADRAIVLGEKDKLTPEALRQAAGRGSSDLERGVRVARGIAPLDYGEKLVLVTDGEETRGHVSRAWTGLSNAVSGSAERTAVGYFVKASPPRLKDLAVVDLTVPEVVRVGEPFRFQVHLSSPLGSRGKLRVHRAQPEEPFLVREVEVRGDTQVTFDTTVLAEGPAKLWAEFDPEGEDAFVENNRVERSIVLLGPPKVLIVDPDPESVRSVRDALSAQKFSPRLSSPDELRRLPSLESWSAIILSDTRRAELGSIGEGQLERYVRGGGTLLFVGGERSYGPGGFEGSALERILPLKIVGEDEEDRPSVAMVLLIDRSGSMNGEPLEMAKAACLSTLSILEPSDLLEVIAFDAKPIRAVVMQRARQRARIESDLSRIDSGGGTEIFPALDMAYKDLLGVSARKKHIVLLTDGNADTEGLSELAGSAFSDGISLTTVGFGTSVNETLLRALADLGGGRFQVARDASLLPRIFTRETELVTEEDSAEGLYRVLPQERSARLSGLSWNTSPPLGGAARLRFEGPPAKLLLALDNGYPLLAERQVGLGTVLSWASDLKSNYARHFLGWRDFSKFVAQLLRSTDQRNDIPLWPLESAVRDDRLIIAFDAFDKNSEFDSYLSSKVRASGFGAESSPEIPFTLVGPGRYEANLSLPPLGTHLFRAEHRAPGGETVAQSLLTFSRPYPEEYRSESRGPRAALLPYETQGPDLAQKILAGPGWARRVYHLASWLLACAALLVVVDIAVRRYRESN
jgi:Ca-activated chloride channel homolog